LKKQFDLQSLRMITVGCIWDTNSSLDFTVWLEGKPSSTIQDLIPSSSKLVLDGKIVNILKTLISPGAVRVQ